MSWLLPELASTPCDKCPAKEYGAKPENVSGSRVKAVVVTETLHSSDVQDVAKAARAAGLLDEDLGWVGLTRCQVVGGDRELEAAEKSCRPFLDAALAAAGDCPLVLVGQAAVKAFMGGKARLGAVRGLWGRAAGGRLSFAVGAAEDVAVMADKLLGREPPFPFTVHAYDSPAAAADKLRWLAEHPGPLAFDIEAYDAGAFPSRQSVATDPCHPEFRLRGVAIAWADDEGMWVDCLGLEPRIDEARDLLSPVFESPAEKWAFSGHYDEEGLVYPGWVRRVRNRSGDGMLAALSLSDGTHDSLRLEWMVVNVLRARQYWDGFDKGKMRDVPTPDVARGAVGDACYTRQVCQVLHRRLKKGVYF